VLHAEPSQDQVPAAEAIAPEAEAEDSGPNRRCLVTGAVLPVERLVRFVIGPDASVVPDVEGRLPGRGFWLSAERDVVNKALAKNAFAKAARRPVVAPGDLADRIESLLLRRCVELLGMARRAAQIVAGFDQVRAALIEGRGGLLIEAADGAPEGRDKLRALAPKLPVSAVLTSDELGAAFGRERFVHVLLTRGRLAERLRGEAERLAGFRNASAIGPGSGAVKFSG
jgi:predicted RNA-binding protein YlxR (DUF448 family)/ribosomal protein L7Ae-like RNA K-turn-binding protein